MANVFISYARGENESAILEIYETLVNEGFSVWMDRENLLPGQEWKLEIDEAIRNCDIFIACLSNYSINKTGFVQAELKKALDVAQLMPEGKIYLIPVRLDDCQVPLRLQSFQWLNYFEAGNKENLLKAVCSKVNTAEILEKELNKFLLQNGAEALKERFVGVSKNEIAKVLLSIAKREDELLSVRSRAVRGLSLIGSLDDSAWSELIPIASTELFDEWIALWGTDNDLTILSAEHIRLLFASRRLPKSTTGLGKAVRKFIKRGAQYTSAVFLPGSTYPAWEVKYDCIRSIISLDDADSMRVLASFSTMSYWKARSRIIEYIESKYNEGKLTFEYTKIVTAILTQIVTDGKTEEKTPTLRIARKALAKLLAAQPESGKVSASKGISAEREQFFDAGVRIKYVREELRLKTSQFIELNGLPSQREYEAIENREKEAPLSLLKTISQISGVNLDWLKHEEEPRYNIEAIYFNPVEKDLDFCSGLKPQEYFLTLDKKSLHVGLIAQTGKYRYQVIETGVDLHFERWLESRWVIPAFYKFLDGLSGPWHGIDGIVLPTEYDQKLFKGDIHFIAAAVNADRYGRDLLYDLLDIDESRSGTTRYSQKYGGNWMPKVHEYFRKYLKAD